MMTVDYSVKPIGIGAFAHTGSGMQLCAEPAPAQTVLIVSSDTRIVELHTRVFRTMWPHCFVLHACNGLLTADMFQRFQPTLVVLDLTLPTLDGFAVLEAMQNDARLRAVPVIVLAARALTQRDMARLNDRVVAVLSEGLFTLEETLTHLHQALSGNKRLHWATRRMVRSLMAYIHEHYAEPLTRDALANVAAVCTRQLTRGFDAEVGLAPMTYLHRYRIREAKRLLWDGKLTITQIARAVGFVNSAYFAVVFRREVGLAPRDYRRHSQALAHQQARAGC